MFHTDQPYGVHGSMSLPLPTTWSDRAAILSEATQALLEASVTAVEVGDKATSVLTTCAARFDSVAASLEEDLLSLSSRHLASSTTNKTQRRVLAENLLKQALMTREGASTADGGSAKRPRR